MERNDAQRHPWKFANRLLSCRLSSSAISLEDDQFGREVREVERGAVRDGRSEISTLWNSMGWFMTAISHQWRHALPRAPFGQHELARTERTDLPSQPHLALYSLIYHLRWTRGKPITRERKSSLSLSLFLFLFNSFFLTSFPFHLSPATLATLFSFAVFMGLINRGINCFCVVYRRFVWSVTLRDEAEIYFSTWIASQPIRAIDCRTVLPWLGHDIRFEVTRRNNSRAKCSSCKRTGNGTSMNDVRLNGKWNASYRDPQGVTRVASTTIYRDRLEW